MDSKYNKIKDFDISETLPIKLKVKKIKKNIFPPSYFSNLDNDIKIDQYYYNIAQSTCNHLYSEMKEIFYISGVDHDDLINICNYYVISYFNKFSISNNEERLASFLEKRKNLIEEIKNKPELLKKLERNQLIGFIRQAINRVWKVSKRISINVRAVKDQFFENITEEEAKALLISKKIDIENENNYYISKKNKKSKVSLTIFENSNIEQEYETVYGSGTHYENPEDILSEIDFRPSVANKKILVNHGESSRKPKISSFNKKIMNGLDLFIVNNGKIEYKKNIKIAKDIISKIKNGTFRHNQ